MEEIVFARNVFSVVFLLLMCTVSGCVAQRIRKGFFLCGFGLGPIGWFAAHAMNVSDINKSINELWRVKSVLTDINYKMNHVIKDLD